MIFGPKLKQKGTAYTPVFTVCADGMLFIVFDTCSQSSQDRARNWDSLVANGPKIECWRPITKDNHNTTFVFKFLGNQSDRVASIQLALPLLVPVVNR